MKKSILIFGLLFGYCLYALGQYSQGRKIDSFRLDSLKRMLPDLRGSKKVDMLNRISLRTAYFAPVGGFKHKIDSCLLYATKAYNDAVAINYKAGLAMALVNLSGVESIQHIPIKDEATKEKNIHKAIQLAEEVNDNGVLGWAYYYLSGLPSNRKDFNKKMEYYKKSASYFQKAGDLLREAEITAWLGDEYLDKGYYESGFEYSQRSLELAKKSDKEEADWQEFLVQYSLWNISSLYSEAGDYATAMEYLRQGNQYSNADIANLFCEMGQYDSTVHYWNKWRNDKGWSASASGHKAWGNNILGKAYLITKQYNKALSIFKNSLDTFKIITKKTKNTRWLVSPLLLIAQAYYGMKNYSVALKYALQSFELAEKHNTRPLLVKSYQQLSSIYHHLGNNDKAYKYIINYYALKDSIQNKQFFLKLYNYKKAVEDERKKAQLSLLSKDNKIKEQQLKQESLIKKVLVGGLILLFMIGIFIFRTLSLKQRNEKLKSQKQQAELQEKATRLEMQALRAQMNPHFIFNCLSSINCFILENQTEKASDYLTRFSRLIRLVLTNSEKSLITLDEELKMLRLYLDMERLRFENSFDYNITYTNDVEAESILVPPLLLQPFCENAIWHGLMHKEGYGHLIITIIKEEEFLNCIITDDGVGRTKAEELAAASATKQ